MTPQEITSERELLALIVPALKSAAGGGALGLSDHEFQSIALDLARDIAATRAAGDAVAWQPIETAPRDGTRFLAATTDDVVMGCYVNEQYFAADSFHGNRDTKPMFWCPVPAISRPQRVEESSALGEAGAAHD